MHVLKILPTHQLKIAGVEDHNNTHLGQSSIFMYKLQGTDTLWPSFCKSVLKKSSVSLGDNVLKLKEYKLAVRDSTKASSLLPSLITQCWYLLSGQSFHVQVEPKKHTIPAPSILLPSQMEYVHANNWCPGNSLVLHPDE